MYPRTYLGRRFDDLGFDRSSFVEHHRNADRESGGIEPDWAIELNDQSLRFLLSEDRLVTTVFVCSPALASGLLERATADVTISDLIAIRGQPGKRGEESVSPITRKRTGAWFRYDMPDCVEHYQFAVGGRGIQLITLMNHNSAP